MQGIRSGLKICKPWKQNAHFKPMYKVICKMSNRTKSHYLKKKEKKSYLFLIKGRKTCENCLASCLLDTYHGLCVVLSATSVHSFSPLSMVSIYVFISQIRKLRFRENKQRVQYHTARKTTELAYGHCLSGKIHTLILLLCPLQDVTHKRLATLLIDLTIKSITS